TCPQPVFVGSLDMHQSGFSARCDRTAQNTVCASGKWIGAVTVGEREKVVRIAVVFMLAIGSCGHRKTHVEHAKTRAGYHRNNTIKHLLSVYVFIKTLIQKLTQQPPAL